MGYNQLLVLISVIFSFIILFTSVAELVKKKYVFVVGNIIIYIAYIMFLLAQYKLKFYVRIFIILLVLITIVGHTLVGQYLDFYHRSKQYDRFLHVFGAFSFSLFVYSILNGITTNIIYSKFYVSVFVAALGISLGCIFEIGEFTLDVFTHSKNQHGLMDTNFDLIANLIGGIIAGIVSNSIFF